MKFHKIIENIIITVKNINLIPLTFCNAVLPLYTSYSIYLYGNSITNFIPLQASEYKGPIYYAQKSSCWFVRGC